MSGPVRSDAPGASEVSETFEFQKALREAFWAALVALGLFGLIVGLKTDQTLSNEIVLKPRPGLLAAMVGAVFIGSLLRNWVVWNRARAAMHRTASGSRIDMQKVEQIGLPAFIAFLSVFPVIVIFTAGWGSVPKWVDNFGILILIYIMLGWGLNIVVGLAGLLDLGYVAFYAIGSYTYALLALHFGFNFWLALPVAGAMAAMWGILLGFPVLRLRGDYLAIVTLAFGEIIYLVALNWRDFTGGGAGLSAPRIDFFGIPFGAGDTDFSARFGLEHSPAYRTIFLYYVILVLALTTAWVTLRLKRLPVGRAWEALREDEIACRAVGMNTTNTKLTAFAIGAMFGGFAGAFFGARQAFITPESFVFEQSALILAIVVLGGAGSLVGVVLAAIVLIGGSEILRELEFLKPVIGEDPSKFRMLIVGGGMVLMMLWRPRGLIAARAPSIFLKERKMIGSENVKEGHG
ncbi:MAG: high-affinity branched-chain amino acid ABC transporter permease LivM [Methylocystis sp.]|nr:high-affinity branched-chain amino acid ABC transporter permease LivM [Methylocystis sp.]MCA3585972.1 high-affinity branched-chain amino acid ABC transporter permease LivM [Methylocystis sp.]MCA3587371.1 high-affinity branched-chain amino acid ABC transporter permease LivM [Methylocystis sp.]MCA3592913.1 high-affinity branched-chain amino acid ABC transporter permease LivM [Methylocystis sp.]